MSIVSIIISTVGLLVIAGIIGYDVATDSGFADLFHPAPEQQRQDEFQPLHIEWEGHDFKCEEWGHGGRDVWCPNPDCPSNDFSDDDPTEELADEPTEEMEIPEAWIN